MPRLHIAIVTVRNAPAHTRVLTTLRSWGIQVDEAFFLGGVENAESLHTFQPNIFFDDRLTHIEGTSTVTPSVHVPFGVANRVTTPFADDDTARKILKSKATA